MTCSCGRSRNHRKSVVSQNRLWPITKFSVMLVFIGITLSVFLTVNEAYAQDSSGESIVLPGTAFMTDVDTGSNRIYVAMSSNVSAVSLINGSTNELAGNLPTGHISEAQYVGIDNSTNKLYLAAEGENMVSIIDLKSIMDHPYLPVHIHDVPLRGPVRGIAVNPTNNMTYVATDLSMDSNGKEIGEVVVINGTLMMQHITFL